MNFKHLYIFTLFSFLFTGCASFTYSIKPEYDDKNKILTIDTLKFNNATLTSNLNPQNSQNSTRFQENLQTYKLQDGTCGKLHYYGMFAGNRGYIISTSEEELKEKYLTNPTDNCEILEIASLRFFYCKGLYSTEYIVATSTRNSYVYSSIERLHLDSACFYTLSEHFRTKAIQDKIEIKKYNLRK